MSDQRRLVFPAKVLSLVSVIYLSIWALNEFIMASDAPAFLRYVVAVIAPPKDYAIPLIRQPIMAQAGEVHEFAFIAKYKGRYHVGVSFNKFDRETLYGSRSDVGIKIKLTLTQVGRNAAEFLVEDIGRLPFLGKERSGYWVYDFVIPDDFSVSREINCRVDVLAANSSFVSQYGPAEIFVQKAAMK